DGPAAGTPEHPEFPPRRGVEELGAGVVAFHGEEGLPRLGHRILRHAHAATAFRSSRGCGLSTSVEWCSRIPPLPLTRMTSLRGAWRSPPSPRAWMTASDSGVMPHM